VSAGGYEDDLYRDLDGMGNDSDICGGVVTFPWTSDHQYLSDGDSALASSPETAELRSPESILEEFLDCDGSAAFDESALQHSFGASSDSDVL